MVDTPLSGMEQTILMAAERLFLERGLALTSTTDIAKEVGCNQALIHYYFRTKDKLFETIFARKAELLFSDLDSGGAAGASFEAMLRSLVEAHFELLRANPRLPFLVINELVTNPSRIDSLKLRLGGRVSKTYERLETALKAEIAEGRVRPMSAFDLLFDAVSLNGAVFLGGPILKAALDLSQDDYGRLVEARKREIVEMLLRGLRPDGARPEGGEGLR